MRKWIMVCALGVTLLAVKAFAQTGSWSGATPRNITFKPIDTSKAIKPGSTTKAFHPVSQPRAFNAQRAFPKLNIASWPPRIAQTSVLDQKSNPYQPTPPKGIRLFDPPKKK